MLKLWLAGVGKWHLGMYNNASTPIRRGFDHFYGYYNGYEDYWTHSVALGAMPSVEPVENGYLDLHDDHKLDRTKNGTYGPEVFAQRAEALIRAHKEEHPDKPMFLYYAMQNVHDPLESLPEDTAFEGCANISNGYRKTFCGMAHSADRAIANLSATLTEVFEGDDVLMVISGDNGGNVHSAGNNCPDINSFCLRGAKATLWEGGIRNNALVCSKTLLPTERRGTSHNGC